MISIQPDTDGSQAAVSALARSIPYSGDPVEVLPGLIRADDGSWVRPLGILSLIIGDFVDMTMSRRIEPTR